MLKKMITYTDYDDVERTEEFHFNLSKAELIELDLGTTGGLEQLINNIVSAKDVPQIMSMFKKIITLSYGIKSPDGKRFMKSQEITEEFLQSEAYTELFMELISDEAKAAAFINAVIPKSISDEMAKNPKPISVINGGK